MCRRFVVLQIIMFMSPVAVAEERRAGEARIIFNSLDKNKDKQMDFLEFAEITKIKPFGDTVGSDHVSKEELSTALEQFDYDGDNQLNQLEFIHLWRKTGALQ